jgi:crotonobetainyl-CoA:carnitine CoA-transferase CaiB-like acyl-CoA transferase
VPAQTFRTRDGHIVVMCMKEKFWLRLCELMGRNELALDPRYSTLADRYAHRDPLIALLSRDFQGRTTAEWLDLLRGQVPCAPVYSVEEALADEQTLARDMVVALEHPEYGSLRQVGTPIKLAGVRPIHRAAARLGADTDDVLSRLGGYSPAEIAELHRRGIV